jgi:hypothetical protein
MNVNQSAGKTHTNLTDIKYFILGKNPKMNLNTVLVNFLKIYGYQSKIIEQDLNISYLHMFLEP